MSEIPLLIQPMRDKASIEQTYLDAVVREGLFTAGTFQMALPRLWSVDMSGGRKPPTPETPIVELFRAVPGVPAAYGASQDADVRVLCVWLPRVVNGSDWLRNWTETQGFEIHDMRELPSKNGFMGDAVATSLETGRLHRMVTIKDGDLLFLVDGSVDPKGAPEDPNLQEIALMAATRFKLLAPSGTRYAEPMSEEFVTSKTGQIAFLLPQSWEKSDTAAPAENGALQSYVTRIQDIAAGKLVIASGSALTTAKALEETLVAKLNNQGHRIGPAEPILQAAKGDYEFSAWRRTGQVDAERSVHLLTLRAGSALMPISIALLSPAPQTQFEAYAVNRRVFEIVLATHEFALF